MADPLPMFPLGTVLVPGMGLPLHVFEERYRRLVADCLAGDRRFGVTLIERGSEVGGGDLRTDAGTVAEIARAERLEDGRWLLAATGAHRIRVVRWLDDDPYPRAEVEAWPDGDEVADAAVASEVIARLRRLLALRTEAGLPTAPATVELDPDPVTATWQAAALGGLGPLDLQRVLTTDGVDVRARLVAELLSEQEELVRARVQLGEGPTP